MQSNPLHNRCVKALENNSYLTRMLEKTETVAETWMRKLGPSPYIFPFPTVASQKVGAVAEKPNISLRLWWRGGTPALCGAKLNCSRFDFRPFRYLKLIQKNRSECNNRDQIRRNQEMNAKTPSLRPPSAVLPLLKTATAQN